MLRRLRGLLRYTRVFSSLRDIQAYRHIAFGGATEAVDVRVREAPLSSMRIRPQSSDAAVLWDTFYEKFHLPPSPLRSGATIFDLGANVGFTAAHFAHLYSDATIIAVELDRANYEAARRNLRAAPHCRIVNAAVWSSDGVVQYDASSEEWGFHVIDGQTATHVNTAPAKTISTLMKENQIETIDYMKMDIEGAEWPVLSTGADWLPKVAALKVELHPNFNSLATYENCARLLSEYGFLCQKDDRHWDTLVATRSES